MSNKNANDLDISAINLKKLRKYLDVNQDVIANVLGVSRSAYSGMERGVSYLTLKQLRALGEKFDVDLNWLVRGVGDIKIPDPKLLDAIEEENRLIDENIELLKEQYLDLKEKYLKNRHDNQSLKKSVEHLNEIVDRQSNQLADLISEVVELKSKMRD